MHGKVINFDLNPREANIFNNVRLLCKAEKLVDHKMAPIDEFRLLKELKKSFVKNLVESTYDILRNAESGVLVDNITYDKSLSTMVAEPSFFERINPVNYYQGIYLLSIHKDQKLIYPPNEKEINLLDISDLNNLATFFHTQVPNVNELSTEIPSQSVYINEENTIKEDNSLTEEQKTIMINQIKQQFYNNLYNWQLTVEGNKITSIKLSTLVELVKTIIGRECFINLLDYSCTSPTVYIPRNQDYFSRYALQEGDIEMGINKMSDYGGKKKKKYKKTFKYIKNRRRNKYKSRRNRNLKKRVNH